MIHQFFSLVFFFFQAEDGIRDSSVTGVQTCALPISIIVTDVGQHQMWEAQYYKHDVSRTLVTSGGLGTLGFALPAAIGAKAACPEKDLWVIARARPFQLPAPPLPTTLHETPPTPPPLIHH